MPRYRITRHIREEWETEVDVTTIEDAYAIAEALEAQAPTDSSQSVYIVEVKPSDND